MNLVNQDFWDTSYQNQDITTQLLPSDPIIPWIEYASSLAKEGSCIEIGAYFTGNCSMTSQNEL